MAITKKTVSNKSAPKAKAKDALIACIGAGNMGSALMKAAAAVIGGASILVSDAEAAKAQNLAKELKARAVKDNAEALRAARYVFLAVKPQVLSKVLSELAPVYAELSAAKTAPVLVSIVAGVSIDAIRARLGSMNAPVVRLMPNTPALIAQGMLVLSPAPEVSAADRAQLVKLLEGAGRVDVVEESYMDAVTGLSGSGPAFAYIFLEALADAGVKAGLPRDKALLYAAQTVRGSAAMVLESGKHPGELKDMVCSPGGTTIAGVAALEEKGLRAAAMAAVDAAFRRAKELGGR